MHKCKCTPENHQTESLIHLRNYFGGCQIMFHVEIIMYQTLTLQNEVCGLFLIRTRPNRRIPLIKLCESKTYGLYQNLN